MIHDKWRRTIILENKVNNSIKTVLKHDPKSMTERNITNRISDRISQSETNNNRIDIDGAVLTRNCVNTGGKIS